MVYTQTDLKNNIWDQTVDSQIASILDTTTLMNRSVREVVAELDLHSMRRRSALSPNLFEDIYDYSWPSDGKDMAICDIIPQLPRPRTMKWELVSAQEFDQRKSFEKYIVALRENDGLKKLRVAVPKGADFKDLIVAPLDSTTSGGGTWTAVGDASNVRADDVNYIEGAGSLMFDIGAGGTGTAGIVNSSLNTFDLTDYNTQGSAFVWVYIVSNLSTITSFTLRLGTDASNFYYKTVTSDNAGNAFVLGWNLLRFDLASATQTGTVTLTSCSYARITMASSAAITNVNNWRFDMIRLSIGRFYDLQYYSKYGWQTSAGVYIENSTTSTDLLNADTDEFDLIVARGKMNRAQVEKDADWYKVYVQEYKDKKQAYLLKYPSDRLLLTQTHYDFNKIIETERDDSRVDRFFT